MSFMTGSLKDTWKPTITVDTTTQSYWLNWRVFLCGIWLVLLSILSSLLIWKYEVFPKPAARNGDDMENQKETSVTLYEDETWRPCLRAIHPAWLLAFRLFAFFVLLVLLTVNATSQGVSIFLYYTDWTFLSITIYFGMGSVLSMHGCFQHLKRTRGDKVDNVEGDSNRGICDASSLPGSSDPSKNEKDLGATQEHLVRPAAGTWGYIFQIMFQMNAGAVILTDCVFWFIFLPILKIKDYSIDFVNINAHTINAIFLLSETALNCLRFPWFRIGYFSLWTLTYVFFQWIVHVIIKLGWPYPCLDLSSSYAPLWYVSVAILHIPCYGILVLIMKLKHIMLSTRYPDSYQCVG